jgi:molecular chaperone DnaK (HSP70)
LRNKLDTLVRSTRRAFTEFGNSLSAEDRKVSQQSLSRADEALQSEDIEAIRQATELIQIVASDLTNVMMNLPSNETQTKI